MQKKFLLFLSLIVIATISQGQSLLSKVPTQTWAVMKYGAENFTKNSTLKKLDSYKFMQDNFFKKLGIDSAKLLTELGINFEKDIYQYISSEDTCFSYVTLLPLNNSDKFYSVVKANYNSVGELQKKNGFNFYIADDKTYFGFNDTIAIIINTSFQNRKNYYDYIYKKNDTAEVAPDEVAVAIDSVKVMVEDTVLIETEKEGIKVNKSPKEADKSKKKATSKKKPLPKSNTAKINALKKAEKLKKEREWFVKDSIENVKRELFYQQQDLIAKKQQQATAEKIISNTISSKITSIENDVNYTTIIEPQAHASVWLNTESISSMYSNFLSGGRFYDMHMGDTYLLLGNRMSNSPDSTASFKSAVNIYFEKDKMRMEQKSFSPDAALAKLGAEVMNNKQNESLLKFINPDNFGHFSMSINTEAMANYYYTLIKKYFNNNPYSAEYSDAVNLYVDFLQILIDEKAIAELNPGNYLFVLHDMKNRLVTYTDYEYDKEFKSKEVKKTKNELSPNFTFVMETKKEDFMQRLINLPLKYAKKEKWKYTAKNGYTEYTFKEGEMPISSLYFMVKDGKGIVTTNKEIVEGLANNTLNYMPDAETKASILNNNYSLKINSKKVLEKLGPEFSTNTSKKINDYFLQNFGDVKMESSLKNGLIQGTTTINIKGNHTNSFEFIFDMMDAINNIMEKEKLEEEKKVN